MEYPRGQIPNNTSMSSSSVVNGNATPVKNGIVRPDSSSSGNGFESLDHTMPGRLKRIPQDIPPPLHPQQRKKKKLKLDHPETPTSPTCSKEIIKITKPLRTPKSSFDFFNGMLVNPEIGYLVAKYLDINSLINLYSLSKDWHALINMRFSSVITTHAMQLAPESAQVFHFKCYKHLCRPDPYNREKLEVEGAIRDVPGFRWLKFILYREKAVKAIIACLAVEGLHLPRRVSLTLKKLWFLMDIPDNARRIRLVMNEQIWTNRDLFLATLFFMKLDMRLIDAIDGDTCTAMRKLLLASPGLTFMYRVLTRQELFTQMDVFQAWLHWNVSPDVGRDGEPIAGVKVDEIGRFARENRGWTRTPLIIRPDDLVMREAARRRLDMQSRYLDMMLWGFVDKKTFRDVPSRPVAKRSATDEVGEAMRGLDISMRGDGGAGAV
ncbi:MAG: hypothetical protein MMC33_009989 [Icmadophila ericetorum]|nr:hypothetical protein [Icmadophila ericetorum]